MTIFQVAAAGLLAAVLLCAVPLAVSRRPQPWVLLALYAFVLPFGSAIQLPGPPRPFNTVSTLMGVVATLGLLVHLLVTQRWARLSGSSTLLLCFVGWVGLTVLWSADGGRSLTTFQILVSLVALFAVTVLVPLEARDVRWLEGASVAGAAYLAADALRLSLTGNLRPQGDATLTRFTTETGDPNITAATLLLPWALCTWWLLDGETGARRLVGLAGAVVLLPAIVLTGSRGGLLAILLGLLVLATQVRRRSAVRFGGYLSVVFVLVGAAFTGAPADLRDHLLTTSSTGRTDIWRVGLQACADGCLWGNGVGSFGEVYRQTYLSNGHLPGFGNRPWAAHNVFLSTFVETGVIGLVLLLAGLWFLLRAVGRLPRVHRAAPLTALVALIASNMLLSNLNFKYFWLTLTYATLCARVYGADQPASVPPDAQPGLPPSPSGEYAISGARHPA